MAEDAPVTDARAVYLHHVLLLDGGQVLREAVDPGRVSRLPRPPEMALQTMLRSLRAQPGARDDRLPEMLAGGAVAYVTAEMAVPAVAPVEDLLGVAGVAEVASVP